MKKFGFLAPVFVAVIMVICFVQCQKERPLGFKIECFYEDTNTPISDTSHGKFYIDTTKYLLYDSVNARYNYCDTTLANLNGVIKKGIAEYEGLHYPALLRVVLVTDTVKLIDSATTEIISRWVYCDTIEVKVEEDNIIDKKNNNPAKAKAYLKKYFIY